jgi:hypothetical protein
MNRLNFIKTVTYLFLTFIWIIVILQSLISFVFSSIRKFDRWSDDNKHVPWSILFFTLIILSWLSYPKILNEKIAQRDNIIESKSQQINAPIAKADEEEKLPPNEFSYKKLGEGYGTLGDTYGALNTLFTGLAFGGLILSIFLQMLELKATRKELAEQKEALKGQHKEFETQTVILNKQIELVEKQKNIAENQSEIINNQLIESKKKNFIDQFNALLEEKRFKIQNLIIPHEEDENKNIIGVSVFNEYAKEFRSIRKNIKKSDISVKYFERKWKSFVRNRYKEDDYSIYSYLRLCRFIFEFIEKSDVYSEEEKETFFKIVHVSFSTEEKSVLMWVGIFRNTINELCNFYSLLENYNTLPLGVHFFDRNAFNNPDNWDDVFYSEHGFSVEQSENKSD